MHVSLLEVERAVETGGIFYNGILFSMLQTKIKIQLHLACIV
jgi:hypothetical protein